MFLKSVLKPVRYCIGVARLLPGQPRILQSRLQILSVSTLHSQLDHSSRALIIRTEAPSGSDTQDHQELKFPYVFLRDNCPCEECLHPVSKGRLFQLQNLDPNITPKKSEVCVTYFTRYHDWHILFSTPINADINLISTCGISEHSCYQWSD